jgi:hypothetical protein
VGTHFKIRFPNVLPSTFAAKNVLLAGVKQVTIIDGGVVGPSDLSAHVSKPLCSNARGFAEFPCPQGRKAANKRDELHMVQFDFPLHRGVAAMPFRGIIVVLAL